MKGRFIPLVLSALAGAAASGQSLYDRHVIFDNAAAPGGYAHSSAGVVAPSTLEREGGRFPVDTAHFFSPPNCLRLRWRSAPGGDWRMTLEIAPRYSRQVDFEGDSLVFWCLSDSELTSRNAPRVYVQDVTGFGTPAIPLVRGDDRIPAGRWVQITLPFAVFVPLVGSTDEVVFDMRRLSGVSFIQGLDDDREHTLYIDDVQIRTTMMADPPAPPPPPSLSAIGFERHAELSWDPSPSERLFAYRIYRSLDGRAFRPIGTQRGDWTRFVDYLGKPGLEARYRVTSLDIDGDESGPSPTAAARTRPFTDEELLDMTESASFGYYWFEGHPLAGLAPEILPGDPNMLPIGGNGFGVMALVAAADRGYVRRDQAAERLLKIVRFLERADRFHGAWPHFLDGTTGKVLPYFGKYDDGGDLVETAFMMEGLLTARRYFDRDTAAEREIRDTITRLWRGVEWDWYRKDRDSGVLYWHWSPDYGFAISHPLIGWNETMIVYLLAIASPTHPVPPSLYHTGWAGTSARNIAYRENWSRTTAGDRYVNGNTYYGIRLDVGEGAGSDLFFTDFSFMGFDPRGIRDAYANYFDNNRAIALINRAYCIANPRRFAGYGPSCWGLSAGVNAGGGRPSPRDDNGTITCMAALASMPYTPAESLAALKHFYRDLGAKVWGVHGFHDAFNVTQNWFDEVYTALNEAPIAVMIENERTGLIWREFMSNPELRPALASIGFRPDPRPAAGKPRP